MGRNPLRKIHSDIIQFRGRHYDFGYQQGELLKGTILQRNREQQYKRRQERFAVPVEEASKAIQSLSPNIWEELMGLQDSLQQALAEILNTYGGYLVESEPSGCSVFTQTDYMVRNYDFHPITYEGRFVLFQPEHGGYASLGPTQHITGRMDGMNEKGLTVAYNFVNRKNPGRGFIPNMIVRMILETCANAEEAIQFLKNIPHFHSFNFIILDEEGQMYVVEATPRDIEIYQSTVCTNHFEKLTEENRYHMKNSIRRQLIISNEQDHITDPYDAFRLFNDTDQEVFSHKYKIYSGTIHTSMYHPQKREVWFALGGNQEPFIIDFPQWLQGENIGESRFYGALDTDAAFLHM